MFWNLHKSNSSVDKSSKVTWWQLDASFLWVAHSRGCIFAVGTESNQDWKTRFIYCNYWKYDSVKGRNTTSVEYLNTGFFTMLLQCLAGRAPILNWMICTYRVEMTLALNI